MKEKIDAWKLSLTNVEIGCIETIEWDSIAHLGYKLWKPPVNPAGLKINILKWYFFYLSGRVFRNVIYSLKRVFYV
jgi:hypothetical protein